MISNKETCLHRNKIVNNQNTIDNHKKEIIIQQKQYQQLLKLKDIKQINQTILVKTGVLFGIVMTSGIMVTLWYDAMVYLIVFGGISMILVPINIGVLLNEHRKEVFRFISSNPDIDYNSIQLSQVKKELVNYEQQLAAIDCMDRLNKLQINKIDEEVNSDIIDYNEVMNNINENKKLVKVYETK